MKSAKNKQKHGQPTFETADCKPREADLQSLIAKTLEKMRERGYSESHIYTYERVYSSLKTYCRSVSNGVYSEERGETFIHVFDQRRPTQNPDTLSVYRSAIRRLNFTMADIEWQPGRKPDVAYANSCFDDVVCEYERYLYRTGKTKKHIRIMVHSVARFLCSVERRGCTVLRKLSAEDIYEAFQDSTDKNTFRNAVTVFLHYACIYGHIANELSLIVPFVPRHKPIPSVYSPVEVELLLSQVDRTTATGKRDYAIILIAARLGLRASDIAALTLSNIRFAQEVINITQVKTKEPLSLTLVPEVSMAIVDYIDNARPKTADTYLFQKVRGSGKISPDSVGGIVRNTFARSGIVRKDRKSGSHALRSSLATALLEEGNDYPTIQKVLGQKDVQTVKYYAAADAEQLRPCALPVPPPAGNFSALLKAGGSNA
jgi:site-specific recombinase XerD